MRQRFEVHLLRYVSEACTGRGLAAEGEYALGND